jgi:hypothetical protein
MQLLHMEDDFEIRDAANDKLTIGSVLFSSDRITVSCVEYDHNGDAFEMATVLLNREQALAVAEEIIRRVKGETHE